MHIFIVIHLALIILPICVFPHTQKGHEDWVNSLVGVYAVTVCTLWSINMMCSTYILTEKKMCFSYFFSYFLVLHYFICVHGQTLSVVSLFWSLNFFHCHLFRLRLGTYDWLLARYWNEVNASIFNCSVLLQIRIISVSKFPNSLSFSVSCFAFVRIYQPFSFCSLALCKNHFKHNSSIYILYCVTQDFGPSARNSAQHASQNREPRKNRLGFEQWLKQQYLMLAIDFSFFRWYFFDVHRWKLVSAWSAWKLVYVD